jgi:hypothetical protein
MSKYLIPVLIIAIVLVSGCAAEEKVIEDENEEIEEVIEEDSGESKTEVYVESIAKELANNFNEDNYGEIFERLLPEIQQNIPEELFTERMIQAYEEDNPRLILDDVELSGDEASVYYTLTYSGRTKRLDAVEMQHIDGEWRFDMFGDLAP